MRPAWIALGWSGVVEVKNRCGLSGEPLELLEPLKRLEHMF
jgi:hypothetical protein